MFDDNNEFEDLFGGGAKGPATLKEDKIDQKIGGIIFKMERLEERNDDGSAKLNERGKPKPLFVTWVITDLRNPEDPEDDGARRIWWKGVALYELQQFLRNSGLGAPKNGGQIFRKWIGNRPTGKMNPLKLYAAHYAVPTLESERQAYEFAQKWNNKTAVKDDMFGPASAPPAAPFAQASSPFSTLDSMRGTGNGGFQGEAPF